MSDPRHALLFARASIILAAAALACAPAPVAAPPPAPVPEPAAPAPEPVPVVRPAAPASPNLPPVPLVTGPLQINVVYPPAGALIGSDDSTFIFGSVGHGLAALAINGVPAPVWPNGAFMAFLPLPPADRSTFELVAAVNGEVARLSHPVRLRVNEPPPPPAPPPVDTVSGRLAVIGPAHHLDPDRIIWGRAEPDPGLVRFFYMPGTIVPIVAPAGGSVRVALDPDQHALVPLADVAVQPPGTPPPVRRAGAPRVTFEPGWVDVAIPTGSPPPYLFHAEGNVLRLTLFDTPSALADDADAGARTQQLDDPLVASVERSHTATRSAYTFNLRRSLYGYAPIWQNGEFVVRIRRHPGVDPAAPLRGLTITLDPGHAGLPGEAPGAIGPTGLREPDANLLIGLRARDLLAERGAYVFMTRATDDPVGLVARPAMAERANAHAFVSIHLNAVPDHVNPFHAHGTSTYYWHPHSRRLAETSHEAMLRNMHLNDLGVLRENYAVIRNPWFPSILPEGAFIIMPDQEAALRTPEYQEAYARSLVEGLEAYFREIAAGR